MSGIDYGIADIPAIGRAIAARLCAGDVIGLSGALGAGKTSLARGVLAALGVAGEVPSPSFAIVQPYAPPEARLAVLHVDLWRIEDTREIDELGLDEARSTHALLVEWPERWGAAAPAEMLRLTIAEIAGERRCLTAMVPPAWEGRWP